MNFTADYRRAGDDTVDQPRPLGDVDGTADGGADQLTTDVVGQVGQ